MSHPKSSHPPTDHHDGAHPEPAETAEQRADRERSARVEEAWVRALKIPGMAIALVFVLLFAWGLSLARDAGAPEAEPPAAPPAH